MKEPAEASEGSSHVSPVVGDQYAPTPAKIARKVTIEHSFISRDQPLLPKMVQKTEYLKRKISPMTLADVLQLVGFCLM